MREFLRANGARLTIVLVPCILANIGLLFTPAAGLWWLFLLGWAVFAPLFVAVVMGSVVGAEVFWERVTRPQQETP